MEFLETPTFTRQITELMDDENYRKLQNELTLNPNKGAIIIGGGGLRKIRWNIDNRHGKSGGVRIIYYYKEKENQILMIFVYPKNVMDNLSENQKKILAELAKEFKNEK